MSEDNLHKYHVFSLFFGFFLCSMMFFSICSASVSATSIGVSPPKLEFGNENLSKSFVIFNPNNETLIFSVKSQNNYLIFSALSKKTQPSYILNGKLKPLSSTNINASLNRNREFFQGEYKDLVFVSVYKDSSNTFKNNIGIKVLLNVTQNLSKVDYYYDNTSFMFDNEISDSSIVQNSSKTSFMSKFTGFSIFDSSLKGNVWVGLALVGLLIVLLYLFIKEG